MINLMIKHQRTSITIHNSTKIGSRTLQSPRTYGVECHELPTPSMMVTTNEHVFGANEAHAKADFCSGKWCLLPLSTSTHLRGIVIRISTSLSLAPHVPRVVTLANLISMVATSSVTLLSQVLGLQTIKLKLQCLLF